MLRFLEPPAMIRISHVRVHLRQRGRYALQQSSSHCSPRSRVLSPCSLEGTWLMHIAVACTPRPRALNATSCIPTFLGDGLGTLISSPLNRLWFKLERPPRERVDEASYSRPTGLCKKEGSHFRRRFSHQLKEQGREVDD